MAARFRLGRPCPHCGAVLVDGATARVTAGGQVRCVALARERSAAHAELNAVEAAPELPAPDPRWDAAQACALAVLEDGGLFAACLVAPRRYASREEARAEAEAALRDVRGARARGREGGGDDD